MLLWPQLDTLSEFVRAGREFDLHCHSISLRANNPAMPALQGPGVICLGRDRQIRFTMYSDTYEADATHDTIAGQLIPEDSVYRLSAIDGSDHEWICDKVFVNDVQPNETQTKAVITGELSELYSSQRIFGEGIAVQYPIRRLTLLVFECIDMPPNTKARFQTRVGDEVRSLEEVLVDVAKVQVRNYQLTLTRHDDLLTIRAEGPTIAPGLDKRVIEAIQFVLARPIWWTILCEEGSDTMHVRLRSAPPSPHSSKKSHLPPIESIYFFDKSKCVWALFAKYLEYVLDRTEASWHPISMFVYSAFISHAAGFDTYRLALGVAVEGILRNEYKDICALDEDQLHTIAKLEDHIRAWKCFPASEFEDSLRKRINSIVSNLRMASASDRLWKLHNMGVITDGDIRAWKKLRHPAAHGHQPGSLPSQSEIDEVDTVITLIYKLVFQAIGYEGKYTDYGTHGWPTREFAPASSVNR